VAAPAGNAVGGARHPAHIASIGGTFRAWVDRAGWPV